MCMDVYVDDISFCIITCFSASGSTSARNVNSLNLRLLNILFRDSDSKHTVLHASSDLIHLGILRQPEPPHELATAPLNTVPLVVLLLLLSAPLSAYLQNPSIFNLHLHLFLLQPRKISLKHMSFWGLFPVNSCVG
ncbi:hypothetical protein CISIN_1g032737mg [Citrus sinensis]|uniref:Uncharacterized protein n=1 Tax=Citrus sinensis TaxID=2711 RepID=A0A067FSY0_CITSI|nr:hypothetical protein CISIN_1g032737mg [Citrus sinensis]